MKLHLVDETIELLIEKKIDKTNNKKKFEKTKSWKDRTKLNQTRIWTACNKGMHL